MFLDEQGPQGHAKVLVGLGEAQLAQLQLLLCAIDFSRKLMDGAAEGGGQVLTQRRHDTPEHVVMENPGTEEIKLVFNSPLKILALQNCVRQMFK